MACTATISMDWLGDEPSSQDVVETFFVPLDHVTRPARCVDIYLYLCRMGREENVQYIVRSMLYLLIHDHILSCFCDVVKYFRLLGRVTVGSSCPFEGEEEDGGISRLQKGVEHDGRSVNHLFWNAQARSSL